MNRMRVFKSITLVLVLSLALSACGGGAQTPTVAPTTSNGGTTAGEGAAAPTATLLPQEQFPDYIPVHPEAYNFEASVASNTYIYIMPGLVKEAVDYIEPELEALGWTLIGKPTIMGHLATFNMEREGYRMAVSMQDNENSKTTRVQMIINKK